MLSVSYLSRESWVLFLLTLCSFMMCTNNRMNYDPMVVFVCLHLTPHHILYHPYVDVSEGIEHLKYKNVFRLAC